MMQSSSRITFHIPSARRVCVCVGKPTFPVFLDYGSTAKFVVVVVGEFFLFSPLPWSLSFGIRLSVRSICSNIQVLHSSRSPASTIVSQGSRPRPMPMLISTTLHDNRRSTKRRKGNRERKKKKRIKEGNFDEIDTMKMKQGHYLILRENGKPGMGGF
ncbi:hypothetical protein BD289DRAFT_212046 [Coniella lustricola]|uniref:Uncharacterized protein n=1 Tax=Coniella lustricola TaxID=2025994 RepID=A0A2T2ZS75_9PEZI|nr:hypothetical protein BD289DRAFT_212046 [Coniella lustricola]